MVGLVLLVAACGFLLRGSWRRRGHELALALVLPAYLVHSLIDIDWDFVAVSAPAFLVAGALARPRAARGACPPFAALAAAGVAALAVGVLVLPWLGDRWARPTRSAPSPARAVTLAKRARVGRPAARRAALGEGARRRQGARAQRSRFYAAGGARGSRRTRRPGSGGPLRVRARLLPDRLHVLEKYTELDNKARPSAGGDEYNAGAREGERGQGARC